MGCESRSRYLWWDKQMILNTVIEQDLDRDVYSWKWELSGQYSVKSAYKALHDQKTNCNINVSEFWKGIWKIKAPPQVLSLIWRASTYGQPTMTQLRSKHVQVNNTCPVCNKKPESIFHALLQCKVATTCWKIFKRGIRTGEHMKFAEWLELNLIDQSRESKAKIVTLCWSIWRSRNDLVWSKRRWPILRIVEKAWKYLS